MNHDKDITSRSTSASGRSTPMLVVIGLAALLLLGSLLGPGWIFSPADPTSRAPAMTLDFADLHTLMGRVPSTGWQQAYFGWLGWLLVLLSLGVAAGAWFLRIRAGWGALLLLGMVNLIATLFAIKGLMNWSQFSDTVQYFRAGGYAIGLGFSVLLVIGFAGLARTRTDGRHQPRGSDASA